jgi:uncharacterized membrane protein YesL
VGEYLGHRWAAVTAPLLAFWRIVGVTALWVVFCLPVITAGASTIALVCVARDDARHMDRPVVRSFLQYVRENLVLGLGLLVLAGGPLVGSLTLTPRGGPVLITVLWCVAVLGTAATLPLIAYGCGLAAHTTQSLRSLYRDSLVLVLASPGRTVLVLGLGAAVGIAVLRWPIALPVLGYAAARAYYGTFRAAFDAVDRGRSEPRMGRSNPADEVAGSPRTHRLEVQA